MITQGTYKLEINREKYETKNVEIEISANKTLYFKTDLIYKYGFIRGSVIFTNDNYKTGTIVLTKDSTQVNSIQLNGNSDFEFKDVEPGNYTVELKAEGYENIVIEVTVVKNKIINLGTISPGYTLGDIEGKINLPFSEELANTLVKIKNSNNEEIASLNTDANGKFSKKGLTKGTYRLEISREKYETKEATVDIVAGRSVYYEDELEYKYGFIRGSVIFINDNYKTGTIVLTKDSTQVNSIQLNGNSDFEFKDVEPGNYTVELKAEGYENIVIEVTVVKNKTLDLGTLSPEYIFGNIEGKVQPLTIAGEPDPIASKEGYIIKLYNDLNISVKETTSDALGEFKIEGVPEGNYILRVMKENYITKDVNLNVKRNQLTSLGTIEVLPGGEDKGWVKGKVYLEDKTADSNSGIIVVFKKAVDNTNELLVGKNIDLNENKLDIQKRKLPLMKEINADTNYEIIDTAITDSYGNYSALVPSGDYVIEYTKESYESTETTTKVEKGKIVELNPIQLKRKVTKLYGYITLPGNIDNSGAIVEINNQREITDKNGYYEMITKVGNYKVKVSKENYKLVEEMLNVTDSSSVLYSKTLEPLKGSIEGFAGYNVENITNNEGITVTLEGTSLDVDLNEINVFLTTTTDSNGHYVIGNVLFGTYKITFSSQGFTSVTLENIKIMPNQKMVLEQIIKLDEIPNSGSIYGKAYLKDSSDMSGIHVLAKKRNGPGYSTITDKDGSFVFPRVESGIYDIEFSKFSYKTVRIEEVKVEVGQIINLEQTPVLERASGKIIGVIKLQGWTHHEDIKVELLGDYEEEIGYRLTTYTDENGNFELEAPIEQNYNGLRIYKNEDFEEYIYSENFQTTENGTYRPKFSETVDDPLILKALATTVKGRVTISSGFDSFLNIKVELLSKDSTRTYETYTDENGYFTFQHIPIGEYIQKSSFPQCGYVLSEVNVIPGEIITTNDVTLIPNAGQVSGFAKLKDMTDSSGILIELIPFETNTQKINYIAKTDASGSYAFGSVLAGKYIITAKKDGWDEKYIDEIVVEELKETVVSTTLELTDTTAPTLTKILINGGAQTTDNAKVIITTFAEDKGSGLDQIMISNTSDFTNATWMPYEFQKIYSLDTQAGVKTVYVKVKDKAGNVSEAKTSTIEIVDLPDMTNLIDYLHGRIVESDAVITKAQSPYYVSDSVLVNEGVTLTIEPGVTLVFKSGMKLIVDGYLVADGSTDEIVFKPENPNDSYTIEINGVPVETGDTVTTNSINTKSYKGNLREINTLSMEIKNEIEETIESIENKDMVKAISRKTNIKYKPFKEIEKRYELYNTTSGSIKNNILKNVQVSSGSVIINSKAEISDSVINSLTSNGYSYITNSTFNGLSGKINLENSNILSSFGNIEGYLINSTINGGVDINNSYLNNIKLTGMLNINNSILENSQILSYGETTMFTSQNSKIINSTIENFDYLSFSGSIIISNLIQNNLSGIYINNNGGGKTYIIYNTITNNGDYGLRIQNNDVLISYNNITGHTLYDIYLEGNAKGGEIEVKNNYFGNSSSSLIKEKIYDYEDDPNFELSKVIFEPYSSEEIVSVTEITTITGQELSGNLYLPYRLSKDYSPYIITDNLNIFGKLIIEPGVEITIVNGKSINVYGTLIADGTTEAIKFYTSTGVDMKDMWEGIVLHSLNKESVVLNNVIIKNTKTAIQLIGSTIETNNLSIQNSSDGIYVDANSKLTAKILTTENVVGNSIKLYGELELYNSNIGKIYRDYDNYNQTKFDIYSSNIEEIYMYGWLYNDSLIDNTSIKRINIYYIDSLLSISNSSIDYFYSQEIHSNSRIYFENNNIKDLNIFNMQKYEHENAIPYMLLQNNNIYNMNLLSNNWKAYGNVDIYNNIILGNINLGIDLGNNNSDSYNVAIFGNNFENANINLRRINEIEFSNNIFKNNSRLYVANDKTTKIYQNTFKDNNNDTIEINYQFAMPEIYNNTFYGNNGYAVVVNNGMLSNFTKNYIALNLGGIKINKLMNDTVDLTISDNVIMMNREYNISNNAPNTVILKDNFYALYTEESISETIEGNYTLNNIKTELITDAGSSEKPDIGDILTYTNLKDYLVENTTLDTEHSPYIVTSDINLDGVIIEGDVEIRISDGRTLTFDNVTHTSGAITVKSLYERTEPSELTGVIVNTPLLALSIDGIYADINSDIETVEAANAKVYGTGNITNYTALSNINYIDNLTITNAEISSDIEINNAKITTIIADSVNEIQISSGSIETYNLTNIGKLTITGLEIDGLTTTTVDEIYLTNTKLNNSNISNTTKIEITGNVENTEFTNNTKIVIKNSNITKSTFDNSPVEIYNVKMFNNEFKNAETAITVKKAIDEDAVYIMKNTFSGNTTDIKNEVTREINAQYNYFADGEEKTEGTVDTTNKLAETPTDEDVVLGHEISGKIILNSIIKSSSDPYYIEGDLVIIGRLIIEPGVTIKIEEGKQIIVRGTLIANGLEDKLIEIKPNTSILIKGKWNGFKVEDGGYLEFNYVKSGYADTFMDIYGSALIENSKISLNNNGFIVRENKELTINNSTISSVDKAFLMYNYSTVKLEGVSGYSISELTPYDNVRSYQNYTSINIINSSLSVGSLKFRVINADIKDSDITLGNYDYLGNGNYNIINSKIINNGNLSIYEENNLNIENSEISRIYASGSNINIISKDSTISYFEISIDWGENKHIELNSTIILEQLYISNYNGDLITKDSTINNLMVSGNISGNIQFNNVDFIRLNNQYSYDYLVNYTSSYSVIFENCSFTRDTSINNYYGSKGVYIGNGAMIGFNNSTFENLDYAIYVDNGALLSFENNKIINNNYGIYFNQFVSPDVEQEISGNYFDNKQYNIYNNTENLVIANGNYWGTTDETEIRNKLYNVEVTTWLTEY